MNQDKVNIERLGSPSKIEGVRGSMTSRVFSIIHF